MTTITVTGTKQKAAWEHNVLPPVEQVRPGLWSVPVPIPNNPLRYVLVYMFELDDGGVAMVDAGWNTDECWQALSNGLAEAGGSVSDVQAVLVTHIHPDHYGLAGRVRDASGAWVGLHPADAAQLQDRYVNTDETVARMQALLELCGVPPSEVDDLALASMHVRNLVEMAEPDVLFEDGRRLDLAGWELEPIWTPGHSPGHVCFYSDRHQLLLSGDHVLPRITPNIAFYGPEIPNPLGDYLDSLALLKARHPDEVLPAHEYRFSDLGARLDELIEHHHERLAEIKDVLAVRPGLTPWQITLSVKWSRPWDEIPSYMQRAANGETLAHLVLLESRGELQRADGVPARFYLPTG